MSFSRGFLLLSFLLGSLFLGGIILLQQIEPASPETLTHNPLPNLGEGTDTTSFPSPSVGEGIPQQREDEVLFADDTHTAQVNTGSVLGITTISPSSPSPYNYLAYPTQYIVNLDQDGTFFRIQDHGHDVFRVDYDKNVTLLPGSTLHILGTVKDATGSKGQDGEVLTSQGSSKPPVWQSQAELEAGNLSCDDCLSEQQIQDIYLLNTSDTFTGTLTLKTSDGQTGNALQLLNETGGTLFAIATNGNLSSIRGVTYSWPSAQGVSGSVLSNDGTGTLQWGTLSASGITADSLDFTEFQDALDLDANLTINATASNYSINIDSNTLYVDSANNRVGVGTASPTRGRLEIMQAADTSSSGLAIVNSGITNSLRIWSDTDGVARLDSGSDGSLVIALNGTGFGNVGISDQSPNASLDITNDGSGDSFRVDDTGEGDASPFVIQADGDVGIGVASPSAKLDVGSGGIRVFGDIKTDAASDTLTFLGVGTGAANTTGVYNTFVGNIAGNANTEGYSNTALGYGALALNTTGNASVAIGNSALGNNTTGNNIAVGANALYTNTTSSGNIAIGYQAMNLKTAGDNNVGIGTYALIGANGAEYNTGLGWATLFALTSGDYNTALGSEAGRAITTGSNNTFLGRYSGYTGTTATIDKAVAIGYNAQVTASNALVLGGTGSDAVVVSIGGDTSPDASLEVVNDGSGDSFLVADTNDGDATPFVIQSDGDVGIGIASPTGPLHLHKSSQPILHLTEASTGSADTDGFDIMYTGGWGYLFNRESEGIRFGANNVSRMTLDGGGNLSVATTADITPDAQLEVINDGTGDSFLVADTNDGDASPFVIQSDGDVGIGVASPGAKLDIGTNDPTSAMRLRILGYSDTVPLIQAGGGSSMNWEVWRTSSNSIQQRTDAGLIFVDAGTMTMRVQTGRVSFAQGGSAGAPTLDFNVANADGDTGIYQPAGDNIAFSTGGTERLRLHSSGNIGIADTSPDASLEVVNDGSGDSFLVADTNDGDASPFVIQSDGDVGIQTASPLSPLHVSTISALIARFESGNDTSARIFIDNTSIGDSQVSFALAGSTIVSAGVDNSDNDYFKIDAGALGSVNSFVVDPINANIGFGTSSWGTSAVRVLALKNGTAPSTSPADSIQLWAEDVSSSSELKVRDEAGNVTTLSPHNFSMFTPSSDYILPWSFYSKNDSIGAEINVDMYGAIAAIEQMAGKQFIYAKDTKTGEELHSVNEEETEAEGAVAGTSTEDTEEASPFAYDLETELTKLLQANPSFLTAFLPTQDSFSLEDIQDLQINGMLVVMGNATFKGNVEVEGELTRNNEQSGSVTVPAGVNTLEVTFTKPFTVAPRVQITPEGNVGTYWVSNRTATGFTLHLGAGTSEPTIFSWFALQKADDGVAVKGSAEEKTSPTPSPAEAAGTPSQAEGENSSPLPASPVPSASASPEPTPESTPLTE